MVNRRVGILDVTMARTLTKSAAAFNEIDLRVFRLCRSPHEPHQPPPPPCKPCYSAPSYTHTFPKQGLSHARRFNREPYTGPMVTVHAAYSFDRDRTTWMSKT